MTIPFSVDRFRILFPCFVKIYFIWNILFCFYIYVLNSIPVTNRFQCLRLLEIDWRLSKGGHPDSLSLSKVVEGTWGCFSLCWTVYNMFSVHQYCKRDLILRCLMTTNSFLSLFSSFEPFHVFSFLLLFVFRLCLVMLYWITTIRSCSIYLGHSLNPREHYLEFLGQCRR